MRGLVFLGMTLAVISSCQCFVPVEDEPDAGSDAGVTDAGRPDAGSGDAGGSDAGPMDAGPTDAGCTRATECTSGQASTSRWCETSPPDAGFSCIENTCLWECPL